jgi:signal transduction histidine kinase
LTVLGRRYLVSAVRNPASETTLIVLYPEQSLRQARWEAALPPLAVGAATILLMVLLSAWLAQRLSRRIQSVQTQVAAIAGGEFIEIETGQRQDEIRELATSVNAMSRQLRQMQQTIRQAERSRLLGQLAGGLAHQLRNAVTGARLAVQLHLRRCAGKHEGDDSLTVALRQLSLTEEQIKGFLSLGRQEQKPAEPCDLGKLIAEIAVLLGPTCEHAQVRFAHDAPTGLPSIVADLQGLRGAVLNLTLNAIEAAGPGGEVHLRVSEQAFANALLIEVRDNGPGPPSELAEALGEPFVTGKAEGVGLGLALARQVAIDHGGMLTWERESKRTCFRITIPLVNRIT